MVFLKLHCFNFVHWNLCDPSLASLEDISPAQIHRADLTSVFFFLLSSVAIYSLNETHTLLHFSLFRSYSFQSFFSCVLLSLSSTSYLSPLSFFAYPQLSLSFFLCLSSTFFVGAFYLSPLTFFVYHLLFFLLLIAVLDGNDTFLTKEIT